MSELTYEDFYNIAGVKQHYEFDSYLRNIIFKKEERERFYRGLLDLNRDLSTDTFKQYFELYAAERKSSQQDYTPDTVARILSTITRDVVEDANYSGYDPTAGTGSLLIQKWHDDMMQENIFSYAPHRYLYMAEELSDNVIPYLIHNFALRGMNAIIVHGDVLERTAKQIYFIQNSKDDFLGFSDVNVLPHTGDVAEAFKISEWLADAIDHKESREVTLNPALPMQKQPLEVNPVGKPKPRIPLKNMILLKDVAVMERAKKGQMYPEGTVIVQISATKGQVGLLTSDGEVKSHYVCINFNPVYVNPEYGFWLLKVKLPRHLHRVKEGLNMTFDDLAKTPLHIPPMAEQETVIQTIRQEDGQYAFDF